MESPFGVAIDLRKLTANVEYISDMDMSAGKLLSARLRDSICIMNNRTVMR